MKKPKKTKPQKNSAAKTSPGTNSGTNSGGNTKASMLGKLILPVVLAVTSFCTVYFLPSAAPVMVVEAPKQDGPNTQADEDTKLAEIETSFVTLESFTVSLKGRSRILRLSITVEAPIEMADMIDPNNPKLRDAFMGYLSALGMEQVQDPAFLVRLRAQLTRRAQFVLGTDSVHNILITDFMVR